MKFPYEWRLTDGYPAKGIEAHGCKVFGTFICGGGSSMGYKLAGYEHLGGVEIDPKVASTYNANHNPKHLYVEDLRKFNEREDLPEELYNLDFLDGSPPCSSFSMAGNRDKDWGKQKKFAEGQAHQRLDNLVYVYTNTINKLQPKVALLENVKGLIQGNARSYAKKIKEKFEDAGYRVQVFLLNAASMGVPQARERVFFIGLRNDLAAPALKLQFNEPHIAFGEVKQEGLVGDYEDISPGFIDYWFKTPPGRGVNTIHPKGSLFTWRRMGDHKVADTLTTFCDKTDMHSTEMRCLNKTEICRIGSYPQDYNFRGELPGYLVGMSVPPVMTAQIANQVYQQWLSKLVGQ